MNSGRWLNRGKSLVIHCAFLTAHNKKKSIRNNIIKMKLTEEKRFLEFSLAVVSCRDETLFVGNVSSTSSGEP